MEPKNVVIFFLPVRDSAEINSLQEAVPTPLPVGVSAGLRSEEISKKDENQEKHGINTPVGVSLYDKRFSDEESGRGHEKSSAGTPGCHSVSKIKTA